MSGAEPRTGAPAGSGRERDRALADEVAESPMPEDESLYSVLGSFRVDGETFLVRRREDDGSHHYDWVSGRNKGYGFSVSGGAEPLSREQHEIRMRGFLSSIDPATGYV